MRKWQGKKELEGEEEKGERTRLGAEKVSGKDGKEHRH